MQKKPITLEFLLKIIIGLVSFFGTTFITVYAYNYKHQDEVNTTLALLVSSQQKQITELRHDFDSHVYYTVTKTIK